MKTKFSKKLISILLSLLMVVSALPMTAITASAAVNYKTVYTFDAANATVGDDYHNTGVTDTWTNIVPVTDSSNSSRIDFVKWTDVVKEGNYIKLDNSLGCTSKSVINTISGDIWSIKLDYKYPGSESSLLFGIGTPSKVTATTRGDNNDGIGSNAYCANLVRIHADGKIYIGDSTSYTTKSVSSSTDNSITIEYNNGTLKVLVGNEEAVSQSVSADLFSQGVGNCFFGATAENYAGGTLRTYKTSSNALRNFYLKKITGSVGEDTTKRGEIVNIGRGIYTKDNESRWDGTYFNIVNDQGAPNTSFGIVKYDISTLNGYDVTDAKLNLHLSSRENTEDGKRPLAVYYSFDSSKCDAFVTTGSNVYGTNSSIVNSDNIDNTKNSFFTLLGSDSSKSVGTISTENENTDHSLSITDIINDAIKRGKNSIYFFIFKNEAGGSESAGGWSDTKIDPSTIKIAYTAEKKPALVPEADDGEKNRYLFSYFTGNAREEQKIHFAVSEDGIDFYALNKNQAIFDQYKGTECARDPYIFKGNDGLYYIIATDMQAPANWTTDPYISEALTVWQSADLINWTNETNISVKNIVNRLFSSNYEVHKAWAPEVFYDENVGEYFVYFALNCEEVVRGEYVAMYGMYTPDLLDESAYHGLKQLLPDVNSANIDADIIEQNGTYYMFYKDETPSRQTICLATSNNLDGPYTYSGVFKTSAETDAIEGCEVYKIGADYVLMADRFNAKGNFAIYNLGTDLANLVGKSEISVTDANPVSTINALTGYTGLNARHGSIIPISEKKYDELAAAFGLNDAHSVNYEFTTDFVRGGGWADGWSDQYHDASGRDVHWVTDNVGDSVFRVYDNGGYVSLVNSSFFLEDDVMKKMLAGDAYTVSFDHIVTDQAKIDGGNTMFAISDDSPYDYVLLKENGEFFVNGTKVCQATIKTDVQYHFDITYNGKDILLIQDGNVIGSAAFENNFPGTGTCYASFGFSDKTASIAGRTTGVFSNVSFKDTATDLNTLQSTNATRDAASLVYRYNEGTQQLGDRVNSSSAPIVLENKYPGLSSTAPSFTIATWYNPGSATGDDNAIFEIGKGGTDANTKTYFELHENGRFYYCWGDGSTGHYFEDGTTRTMFSEANKWYFVEAIVVPYGNKNVFSVYVNGNQVYRGIYSGTNVEGTTYKLNDYLSRNTATDIRIGQANAHWTASTNGYFDDFRIYSKAIDPQVMYEYAQKDYETEYAQKLTADFETLKPIVESTISTVESDFRSLSSTVLYRNLAPAYKAYMTLREYYDLACYGTDQDKIKYIPKIQPAYVDLTNKSQEMRNNPYSSSATANVIPTTNAAEGIWNEYTSNGSWTKNILYSANETYDSYTTSYAGIGYTNGTNYQVFYNTYVLLYDGINTPTFPVSVKLHSDGNNRQFYTIYPAKSLSHSDSNNNEYFLLNRHTTNPGINSYDWQGYDGRINPGWTLSSGSGRNDGIGGRAGSTDRYSLNIKNTNNQYWFNCLDFVKSLDPSVGTVTEYIRFVARSSGTQSDYSNVNGGDKTTSYNANRPTYVINYRDVPSWVTKSNIANINDDVRVYDSKYSDLYDSLVNVDKRTKINPNNYNWSDTANAVNQYNSDYNAAYAVRSNTVTLTGTNTTSDYNALKTALTNASAYVEFDSSTQCNVHWKAFIVARDKAYAALRNIDGNGYPIQYNSENITSIASALEAAIAGLGHIYDGATEFTSVSNVPGNRKHTPNCVDCNVPSNDENDYVSCNTSFSSVVKTPSTCTTQGYHTYTCNLCRNTYDSQDIAVDNDAHNYVGAMIDSDHAKYTCSYNAKHYYTIDLTAYNADVESANAELRNVDKYTSDSLTELQNVLDNNKFDINVLQDQSIVDSYANAITTANKIKDGDNGGVLELAKYDVTFKTLTDGDLDTVDTYNDITYGTVVDFNAPKADNQYIAKWTVDDNDYDRLLATSSPLVSYAIFKETTVICHLTTEVTTDENTVKVVLLDRSNRITNIAYVAKNSTLIVDNDDNSNNKVIKVGDDVILEATDFPFYYVADFTIDGTKTSVDNYAVTNDIVIKPIYSADSNITITAGSANTEINGEQSASYTAKWDETVVMSNENAKAWYIDDALVATGTTYKFQATSNVTVTYSTDVATKASSRIDFAQHNGDMNKTIVVISSGVPAGATITEQGIYALTSSKESTEQNPITVSSSKVIAGNKKFIAHKTTKTGTQAMFSLSSADTIHTVAVVSYVTYELNEIEYTVYSSEGGVTATMISK